MHSPQDQNMKWAQGKGGEHMAGSDEAKCMLIGVGNTAVHWPSEKSQQSSGGLIGVIMGAVASTYQYKAQACWIAILAMHVK